MTQLKLDDLTKVGNVDAPLDLSVKAVRVGGLVITPELVLKLYWMLNPEKNIEPGRNNDLQDFLKSEIQSRRIEPEIGLGFAIYSEGYLNVSRWRKENPIVLRNQVYSAYPNSPIKTMIPADISSEGSFCLWELEIVDHEREAWKKYLESKRTADYKYNYINNWIIGRL